MLLTTLAWFDIIRVIMEKEYLKDTQRGGFWGSQACQAPFVALMTNLKKDGFFIEIGSNDPIHINNTYKLEKVFGWKGLMFELKKERFEKSYSEHRSSQAIWGDATKHNYKKIFEEHNVPKVVDYLQLDIDPAHVTLEALNNLNENIMDDYKFSVVTYEHDFAHTGNPIHRLESREIFEARGYSPVFKDVANNQTHWVFEDWYVHPDLVDMEIVEKLQFKNKDLYQNTPNEQTKPSNYGHLLNDKVIIAQEIDFVL